MGLSSLFRKKPQPADAGESAYQSRAEEETGGVRQRAKRKTAKQAAEPIDPVLPEKKSARRRLVGAVALVLAAIIGLPMILDSEPKPLGDDVVIQIPSKEAARNMPLPAAVALPRGAALDQSEEVIDPTRKPSKNSTVAAESADKTGLPTVALSASKSTPKPTSKSSSDVKPESQSEIKTLAKLEPKPTHSAAADTAHKSPKSATNDSSKADENRAEAILNGGADGGKSEKKSTKMSVQVAALASQEKVAELRDKLSSAGIASYTQTVSTDSGPRIRVRIGPFGNKDEAEKTRAKLTKLGLNGTLIPG